MRILNNKETKGFAYIAFKCQNQDSNLGGTAFKPCDYLMTLYCNSGMRRILPGDREWPEKAVGGCHYVSGRWWVYVFAYHRC